MVGIVIFINELIYGQSEAKIWVFGVGVSPFFWFPDTLGLNLEALYKSGLSDKLPSHFYCGLSLVFCVKSGKSFDWRNGY